MPAMKVWVRKAPAAKQSRNPRWVGGRTPLSTELAHAVRLRLDQAAQGIFDGPELTAVRPLLELQARWSEIPRPAELLIEQIRSREGFHTLISPFAGRLVHELLPALFPFLMTPPQPTPST